MRQRRSVSDRGLGNGSVPMTKPVSFFSTCPACGQQQLQLAYTRRALLSLLKTANIIDAYCLACDVVWVVSVRERNLVVAAIVARQLGATPTPGDQESPRRPL
jgi:hypothetical protein